MVQSSPWFGVGLGNFLVALPSSLPSRAIYFLQPVHNIYLLLLSEIGIVGIGVLGWVLRSISWSKKYILSSPITASLVGLLLLGLVDHYVLTLQQGRLLLTVLLGLWIARAK
jgi:O-antigen ligase